jgi:hypothetical protein
MKKSIIMFSIMVMVSTSTVFAQFAGEAFLFDFEFQDVVWFSRALGTDPYEELPSESEPEYRVQMIQVEREADMYPGEKVLEIEAEFTEKSYSLMIYPEDLDQFNLNEGIVEDVGVIKSISFNFASWAAPATVMLNLSDQNGNFLSVHFPVVYEEAGWSTFVWLNQLYWVDVPDAGVRYDQLKIESIEIISENISNELNFEYWRAYTQAGGPNDRQLQEIANRPRRDRVLVWLKQIVIEHTTEPYEDDFGF